MKVFLPATLDTKGKEFAWMKELLRAEGLGTIVADAGVLGPPEFPAEITREEVFAAAGTSLREVLKTSDRGQAMQAAARGMAALAARLHQAGEFQGILGMGGSAGTTIATQAMRALPIGLPKIMVSTLASGQVRPFVGVSDIAMLHSVVDISGLNRICQTVLANAAGAMAGMLKRPKLHFSGKPLIGATMFGVTTPCVDQARKILEAKEFEVMVFHATGAGGMTFENFLRDGLLQGSLDLTTTELADELVGGILSAGPDRLTAAARRGIPQVISLGALDMVNFGPMDTVPEKFKQRKLYAHNANVTLMRTTPEENDLLGKEIAMKASASKGKTAVLAPLRGVSALDAEGKPFYWPEANQALFSSLRLWMSPEVELIELDLHINDPAFAQAAAEKLLSWI
ncbi:MAG: UPF0261 family protein [Gemmataceae bacterium]|nr:UPF0261 family protein [Gemmataceae bacterium]